MVAESKALLAAVEIVKKGDQIKKQVDAIISEKTKPYQQIANLNKTTIQLATLNQGSLEASLVKNQYDNLIDNSENYKFLNEQLNIEKDLLKNTAEETAKIIAERDALYEERVVISQEINKLALNKSIIIAEQQNYLSSINPDDPTIQGGIASIQRDRGSTEWKEWIKDVAEFDSKISETEIKIAQNSTRYYELIAEEAKTLSQSRTTVEDDYWGIQNKINDLSQKNYY